MADFISMPASTNGAGFVSSAFALGPKTGALVIQVPSVASVRGPVSIQFAEQAAGPFTTLNRPDGGGSAFVLQSSGAGGCWVTLTHPPSPFGRFLVNSPLVDASTFTLFRTSRV